MTYLVPSVVHIPSLVNDMITVDIKEPLLSGASFTYYITDLTQQVHRKGQFRGLRIQLRLSHLKDGPYSFNLQTCDIDGCSFAFEKISTVRRLIE